VHGCVNYRELSDKPQNSLFTELAAAVECSRVTHANRPESWL